MKINNLGSTSGINPYKKQISKIDNLNKTSAAKGTDKVEISTAAKEMQQISKIELVRQQKVEELKNQVMNGSYKIDPKEVAKSLINYYSKN